MSIKVPGTLRNVSNNYPLVRAEDNQVAGLGYFTSLSLRNSLPGPKRTSSFIAVMSLPTGDYIAQFTGDAEDDNQWVDVRNWATIANEENVFEIAVAASTRRNNTTNNVGEFTNGILGDYDQDGKVNIDDFLSFFTGYVATASTSARTGNTASDRLSGVIGNTTEHLATWEFENYDGTNDFMLATTKAIEEQINLRDLFSTPRTLTASIDHTLEATFAFKNNLSSNMLSVSDTAVTVGAYSLPLVDGADRQFLMANGDGTASWTYVEGAFLKVQNDEATQMPIGTPIYAKGLSGNTILVGRADADDSSKMPCIGVIYGDTLAPAAKGEAITSGLVNKDITGLTGVQVGDTLYVSTAGTLTRTKPAGVSSLIQNVGTVLQVNGSTVKKFKVSAIDRTNDIPNITAGKFMVGTASYPQESFFTVPSSPGGAGQVLTADGSGATSWQTPTAGSGTVDASGTPANNQLAVWVDADTIEGDVNLTWTGALLNVAGTAVVDRINIDESGLGVSSAGQYGAGSRVLDRIGSNTLSITAGDLYYLGSASWAQADADAASTASGLLAIATSTASNNGMLVSGVVKVADNTGFSSSNEGDVLYVSTTAGHVTTTAPTATGDIVRVVGYVLDPTNGIIYFDPSKDWIELS